MIFKKVLTELVHNSEKGMPEKNMLMLSFFLAIGGILGFVFTLILPKQNEVISMIIGALLFAMLFYGFMIFAFLKYRTKKTNYLIALDEAEKIVSTINPYEFITLFNMVRDYTRKTMDPSRLNKFVKLVEKHHTELEALGLLQNEHKELSDESWLNQMKVFRETRLQELTAEIQAKGIAICDLKREITGSEEL